jgi:regulator of protease activity HflC (stomatin/prohibitin superfamily)
MHADTIDPLPSPQQRKRWVRFVRHHLPSISVLVMAGMLIAIVMFPYSVITVASGHVGVLWKRFNGYDMYCWCFVGRGTILDPIELREEGLHLVWPWDKLFIYNLRLQSLTQTYNAITKDGVSVNVQVSIRFQLLHNPVGVLHKFIGPHYFDTVVSPEIGSQTREVVSQYTAQEVYTSRESIQEKIRNNSQKSLGANLNTLVQPDAMEQPDPKHYNDFLQNSIQILDTLVLSIELPPAIVAAINRQTEQYYQIQEFKYRVEREAQEARRKQIEANGIAAFQRTVSQGISDSYLRWRGIEATLALAQSKNSKIVVIGSGKDGMPIILGNVDSQTQPAPPEGAPAGAPGPTGSTHPEAEANALTKLLKPSDEQHDPSVMPRSTNKPPEASGAAAKPDGQERTPTTLDLSDIKALLSRISEALHLTSPPSSGGPAEKPKQ